MINFIKKNKEKHTKTGVVQRVHIDARVSKITI